jgi:hypothetical protein
MDNIIILLLSIVFTLICIVLLKITLVRDQAILFVCTLVAFLLFYTIINKINVHKDKDNEINIMADLEAVKPIDHEVDVEDDDDDDEGTVVSDDDDGDGGEDDEDIINQSLSEIWESSDNPSFHIGK